MNRDYFSLWIENLGVVPWFSFLFFLFLPIFLSLSLLLHLVCIVFDAMSLSLSHLTNISNNYRGILVTLSISIVKILFTTQCVYALEDPNAKEVFISKGEQIELSVSNLESFIVGNKEIIKYKYFKRKKTLLVQGKSLGYTDLSITTKSAKSLKYKIYVISKREQQKIMTTASALQKTGLKVDTFGDIIYVAGIIKNLNSYLIFNEIFSNSKLKIIPNLKLDPSFIKPFVASLYKDFYTANFKSISCEIILGQLHCQYSGKSGKDSLIKKYSDRFYVHFSKSVVQKSLRVQLLFVLQEQINSQNISSGLSKISMPLSDYIEDNNLKLSTSNINMEKTDNHEYIISSPEISAIIGEPFEVKLGTETPVQRQINNTNSIEYKFSGIKFKGSIQDIQNNLKLRYQFMATKNQNDTFSGPSGSSSFFAKINELKLVYQVNFKNSFKSKNKIPWISEIPLIGDLLSRQDKATAELKLNVYVTLKEES